MSAKSSETKSIVWDKRRKRLTARTNAGVYPLRYDRKVVFLTLDDVAKWLRVTPDAVRGIIERKSSNVPPLRAVKVAGSYRIMKEDLNRWLRVSTMNEYAFVRVAPEVSEPQEVSEPSGGEGGAETACPETAERFE